MTALTARVLGSRAVGQQVARLGAIWFGRTGRTPRPAYAAMRKLFGAHPEQFYRLRDDLEDREHLDKLPLAVGAGIASGWEDRAVDSLRRDGLVVLPTRLDEATCDSLLESACASLCRPLDGPIHLRWGGQPPPGRCDFDESVVAEWPAAQSLIADESLFAVAWRYLGAMPVQDLVAAWWTAPAGGAPSSEAAQLFHFDLDRLRFLKVFVYVTDVTESRGPHSYVLGSHRSLPPHLRVDRRFTDAEVLEYFGPERIVEVIGPRGTVFLADTIGLHKGVPPVAGERLVFQLEYATSLFGNSYDHLRISRPQPELRDAITRHPETFRRFCLADGGS